MRYYTGMEDYDRTLSGFALNIREIVYGGSDGIITTFAIVSSFSGAHLTSALSLSFSVTVVLLFGFANLFADGVSMGLGNFLSLRSAKNLYRLSKEKELREIREHREHAIIETVRLLRRHGFSETDAGTMVTLFQKNESYWLDFMMRYGLDIPNVELESSVVKPMSIFAAFLVFGAIPLLPFLFAGTAEHAFSLSIVGASAALILLGIARAFVTKEHMARAIGEVLIIGIIAGSVAFFIGSLFEGML